MLQVVVVKLLFLLWRFQPRGEVQTRVPASSGAEDLSSGGLCCRYINVDLSPAGCALCCSQPQSAQKCYRVCVCVCARFLFSFSECSCSSLYCSAPQLAHIYRHPVIYLHFIKRSFARCVFWCLCGNVRNLREVETDWEQLACLFL